MNENIDSPHSFELTFNSHLFFMALMFASSVAASLFFNGMHVEYFSLAMSLLIVWVAVLCWQGLVGKRALSFGILLLMLGVYQGWLLLTLLWNPVAYLGVGYFWLLATPLLVVVAWHLAPSPEQLWRYIWPMLLVLGAALMVYALYQYYWLAELPHATFINRNSLAAMLMLLMLIAAGRVLLVATGRKFLLVSLVAFIFLAALLVGLVASRGAFLGLAFGVLVLIAWGVCYQQTGRGRIWLTVAAISMGIAISSLPVVNVHNYQILERVGSLSDPYSAGSNRFLIWGQSLKMVEEKPLSGHGLGTYWQHWPQWRDPADSTSGFWAHNDLLHLGVEAGLPAVLLLLFVHFALLVLLWRILCSSAVELRRKGELVALFAGLLAVAVHAQFTFNYYNLPILLVLSLMMARIARVEREIAGVSGGRTRPWLRSLVPVSALLVVIYFATVGAGVIIFEHAVAKMRQGDFQEADLGFVRAQKFWGSTDMFPYTHALLKEQQLVNMPTDDIQRRKALFIEAQQLLDIASANNPLRAIPYFIRGRLLVTAAELAGEDWLVKAETAFKKSLTRDPLYLESRLTLARILEVTGRQSEAGILLEEGAMYHYPSNDPNTLTYYKMIAASRSRTNDLVGAAEMIERHNQVVSGLIEKQRLEQALRQRQ